MTRAHILVVDDEPDIRLLVQEILQDEDFEVSIAENGIAARQALRDSKPDLVLLDIWMPDLDGISLLKEWQEQAGLPCPVIMMSGHGSVETAVEATRLGAFDFLEKPLTMAKLILTVERALEVDKLQQENKGLKQRIVRTIEPIGRSSVMQRLREQVKRIAQHDTWVLISGEAGSGRETFARYLHNQSHRKDRPFIDISLSKMTGENAGIELFGREQNKRIQYGALEQARGGTLFLNEVAEMDLTAQGQLLGALNTGSFMRIGGTEPVQIDVRIIAATQKNLAEEVQQQHFREDLFYHLNVVPLQIPALRDHHEDVPELLSFYVDNYAMQDKLPYRKFNVSAQNYLRNYNWLGNVRELKNLVQRILILGAGDEITQEEVESAIGSHQQKMEVSKGQTISFAQPLRAAREAFEKVYLQHHFDKKNGNVSKMAASIGMERTHLYRKLKSLDITIKEKK